MATGRTLKRWSRIYIDGFDMSGYTRELGPLAWTYPEIDQTAILDGVKGVLTDAPEISPGTLNGIFNNTATSGIHAALSTAGVARDTLVAIGIQAEPAAGDPVFMGSFAHTGYIAAPSGGDIVLTCPFGKVNVAEGMNYEQPWGVLLHASAAKTGANTGAGVDLTTVSTAKGGYLMYQILAVAGTGTATISIDDSANNSTWLALSGATSGAIAHTAAPCAGIIQLGTTATVRRYVRWQLALDGITSCTFVLGFVRGR
jgi:hypothetical protein